MGKKIPAELKNKYFPTVSESPKRSRAGWRGTFRLTYDARRARKQVGWRSMLGTNNITTS